LRVTLAKTLIRAPFAGTLGLRRVSDEGAQVITTNLLRIRDDAPVSVAAEGPAR